MQFLNERQRVAAASLLKRRPVVMSVILNDPTYQLWYQLVCSEIQRLGIIDPSHVQEFCDRAGVSFGGVTDSKHPYRQERDHEQKQEPIGQTAVALGD